MTTRTGDGAPRPGAALAPVRRGLRALLPVLALAPLWGLLMALSAFVALAVQGRAGAGHWSLILLLFFSGGLLAFPPSVVLARALARHRPAETRFAAAFLCLTVLTIAMTAGLFALQYRMFFSRWHAPFLTPIWFFQFGFTTASALYQFIVMGVRLYMPAGIVALVAMSLWLARPGGVRR